MATPSLDEETSKKLLRQVEFYFSDSNLPRDNFLKNSIAESQDGMVSLALICSFTRMRKHLSLGDVKSDEVPEDTLKAVAETLRKSTFLKVSEDGKKIGRTTELLKPEEVIEQLDIRTIAASPFQYDVKHDDLEAFFGQVAKVNSIRLPHHVVDKRFFCGTALIEFSSEEDAKMVLKQSLVYAGIELELRQKKEFDAERMKKIEEYEKSRASIGSNHNNNSSTEEKYTKGLIVAFTLKMKTPEGFKEENDSHEAATDGNIVHMTDRDIESSGIATEETEQKVLEEVKSNERIPGEMEENKDEIDEKNGIESEVKKTEDGDKTSKDSCKKGKKREVKSTASAYKDNMNVVLREDLKAVFEKFGTVKFIDFSMGADSGYIRFEEPEGAQKARAAVVLAQEDGLPVKNFIATLEPVTGEAEKEYWSLLHVNQEKRKENNKSSRGRGGRYNTSWKSGRPREHDSASGRPNKAQKVGAR